MVLGTVRLGAAIADGSVDPVSGAVLNDEVGRVVEPAACRCTGASLTRGENIEGVDDLYGAFDESREVGCCICELEGRQISAARYNP